MLEWADAAGPRAVPYVAAASACAVAGRRDRGLPGHWAPFWPLTAALLVAMAAGRAGLAEALADELRDTRSGRLYEWRRPIQAAAVVAIGGWLAAVIAAVWRAPERRRHYGQALIAIVTLVAFAAIRGVSLHHIDSVLQDRRLAGLRVGAWIEYALATSTAAALLWTPWRRPDLESRRAPS